MQSPFYTLTPDGREFGGHEKASRGGGKNGCYRGSVQPRKAFKNPRVCNVFSLLFLYCFHRQSLAR